MDFRKLPSNSEGLLLKLVCSENPTQVCLSFGFAILSFKKPSTASFDVLLGFLLSSIPQPRGNRGYFGA